MSHKIARACKPVRSCLRRLLFCAAATLAVAAQVEAQTYKGLVADADPYHSTYQPQPAKATALINATILTGTGAQIERGTVLMADGKIAAVGAAIEIPADAVVIDAAGKWITPGIVDPHSHIGMFAAPRVEASTELNEKSDPNTANVWVEHAVWPQDPQFSRARAGGVTTMLILPGSANLIGGRTVTLKNVQATTVQAMKFPGAPYGLKMACGENPKTVYGAKGRSPVTRMGVIAGFRTAWLEAGGYAKSWADYRNKKAAGDKSAAPPKRDLKLDTLAGALDGSIHIHVHCYRADEMQQMIDLAKEFGFKIAVFHHASEAYKIADVLAREQIAVATWATRWGLKLEMYDGIEENAAMLDAAGVVTAMHSDAPDLSQRMNIEAAVAMAAGQRAGLPITRAQAIRWITANPARELGVLDRTGTLEPGKMADVVLWSTDPFSIYALAEKVYIDGALVFDRSQRPSTLPADFELGRPGGEEW